MITYLTVRQYTLLRSIGEKRIRGGINRMSRRRLRLLASHLRGHDFFKDVERNWDALRLANYFEVIAKTKRERI